MMWQFAPGTGGGGGPTNLSYDSATRTLSSSTGTDVVLPLADGAIAGLMSSASVIALSTALQPADIAGKQDTLVSGTNIKTINGNSILGSGDLVITGGATNLSYDAPTGTVASDTGTDAVIPLATATVRGLMPRVENSPERFYAYADCVTLTGSEPFASQVGSTGGIAALIGEATPGIGWARFAMGSTAGARAAYSCQAGIQFGNCAWQYKCRIVWDDLSDASRTYTTRMGFLDSITGESIDAIYFRYTHGTNSGKFQAVTRASSAETATDTGVTVTANTEYILRIIVNNAADAVLFYINGALVATHTTNIPNGASRETGVGAAFYGSAGAIQRNAFRMDYQMVEGIPGYAR